MKKPGKKRGGMENLRPPFQPGNPGNGGRRKGAKDKVPRTFKKFAAEVCKDANWQEKIRAQSEKGNSKAIEAILHYGEGKPPETVEVGVKVGIAALNLTDKQRKQMAEALLNGA